MRKEISVEENKSGSGNPKKDAIDQQIAEALRNLPGTIDADTKAAIKASLEETFQKNTPASNLATVCLSLADVTVSDNDLVSMIQNAYQIIGTDAFEVLDIVVTHP